LVILVASVLSTSRSLRRFDTAARVLRRRVGDTGAVEVALAVAQARAEALRDPMAEAERRAATLRARRSGSTSGSRHGQ
jgi:hypothetical protein